MDIMLLGCPQRSELADKARALLSATGLHCKFAYIWVRSQNCGCLVTWFCYLLIAKQGNKTAAVPWPDPYVFFSQICMLKFWCCCRKCFVLFLHVFVCILHLRFSHMVVEIWNSSVWQMILVAMFWLPGLHLNIKTIFPRYGDFHVKD